MRGLDEIRKKVKWVSPLFGETFKAEMELNRMKCSAVFGYDENGWEHVSVSPYNGKTPTWDDMCVIKDMFWEDEEEVIQIHPKKSEYVNLKDNCLHLWRHKDVGLPRQMNQARETQLIRAAKTAYELVVLNVLSDKFDFTTEDLEVVRTEATKLFAAVGDGYVNGAEDLMGVLREEHSIEY